VQEVRVAHELQRKAVLRLLDAGQHEPHRSHDLPGVATDEHYMTRMRIVLVEFQVARAAQKAAFHAVDLMSELV
jgi:hypothetical protein